MSPEDPDDPRDPGDPDDPDDDVPDTREDDDLFRAIAAAPAIAIPSDLATFILLEPGTLVDGAFRIDARIGAGGMGVVYAAHDLKLGREVALKLMRLDHGPTLLGDKLPEVFEREARATARLNHPNVVTLHQFGNWNGLLYLVLERLRGETLNARSERTKITLPEGLVIMERVAWALVHTHAAGITHRDLKPQNVFLLADGGVKVLDFGVSGLGRMPEAPAGTVRGRGRSTLSLAGTPGYMAPEQWAGGAQDARTDVFAVGVMLYQLVTGELPFGTSLIAMDAVAPSVAGRLPPVARSLGPLVAACLAPRLEDRLGSAEELADRLRALRVALGDVQGETIRPVGGHLAASAGRTPPRSNRAAVGAAAAVVAIAIAAAAVAVIATRGDGSACASHDRLRGVWEPSVRAPLAAKSAAWAEVARGLETYATQWQPLRDAACHAAAPTVEACLDARFAAFTRLVGHLGTLSQDAALLALRGMPALSDCSDADYLARPPVAGPAALAPWALTVSGRGADVVRAATFVGGELVIAGDASAGATLAGTPLVAPPGEDERFGFVARLGSDGAVRWAQVLVRVAPVALATSGADVVVVGTSAPGARIGGLAVAASGEGVLAVLDGARGEARWAHAIAAPAPGALASDAAGNIYTAVGATVASYTTAGAPRWQDTGAGLAAVGVVTAGDALVVASAMTGAATFQGQAMGAGGCAVGRLAPATGAVVWSHAMDEACTTIALGGDHIAVGGPRSVGVLARADGAVAWTHAAPAAAVAFAADGTLTVVGAADALGRFDAAGHAIAAFDLAGVRPDLASWLFYGPVGQLVVGGSFATSLTVGERELHAVGPRDGFVLELSPEVLDGLRARARPASAASP